MSTTATTDLNRLFESELQSIHEDVRRQAALRALRSMRPSNRVTVEEFFAACQKHKDIAAVVGSLGVSDFAAMLLGRPSVAEPLATTGKRTRLSDAQKAELKGVALRLLETNRAGLSRTELAALVRHEGRIPHGVAEAELPEKLRIPLAELLTEGKAHTVGAKRLMKYLPGKGR